MEERRWRRGWRRRRNGPWCAAVVLVVGGGGGEPDDGGRGLRTGRAEVIDSVDKIEDRIVPHL